MRIRHFLRATLLIASLTTVAAAASADVAGAQTFVEKEHGNLKKLVETNAPATQVSQAIDAMVDYDELARRTIERFGT